MKYNSNFLLLTFHFSIINVIQIAVSLSAHKRSLPKGRLLKPVMSFAKRDKRPFSQTQKKQKIPRVRKNSKKRLGP